MEGDNTDGQQEAPAIPMVNINPLQLEATIAEITRRLTTRAEQIYANILPQNVLQDAGLVARGEQAGAEGAGAAGAVRPIRARRVIRRVEDHSDNSDEEEDRYDRNHHRRHRLEENTGNLKLRIPPFQGKMDPDAYLEWEKKIEYVFKCQNYTRGTQG